MFGHKINHLRRATLPIALCFFGFINYSSCQSSNQIEDSESKQILNIFVPHDDTLEPNYEKLYKEQICSEKEKDLKIAVNKIDPDAYDQGLMCDSKCDYVKAMEFFQEAIGRLNIKAEIMLADIYLNHQGPAAGNSKNKNYLTAFELFDDAAEERHWLAYYALCMCYQKGYGVKKDFIESNTYFKLAEKSKNFT